MRRKKIKTALIVPKGSKYGKNEYLKTFLKENDIVSDFYGTWETPNLSLLTIAGLFPEHYELHFYDEDHGERIPFEEKFDLVMLTSMTQQVIRAYEICRTFRASGCYTVLGGIHATIFKEEALQNADTVIIGEGEEVIPKFLSDFEHNIQKRLYEAGNFIVLSKSPVPRYDLVNKQLYRSYSIQTTRGCPRTCAYCTLPVMYGAKYRRKQPEQIIKEIRAVKQINPSPFIFFADDNMFIDEAASIELLKVLAEEDIVWGTQTDISVAEKPELLKLLKASGCRWLFIGFENIRSSGLELLDRNKWKARMSDRYEKMIEKIHNAGVYIWGSFLFGTDDDSTDVFENTLDFTIRNGIYSGSFTILTPLPGTELFNALEQEGRISDYDWSRYTFWDVVFQPKRMTSEELASGVAWVYSNFYSKENANIRLSNLMKSIRKRTL